MIRGSQLFIATVLWLTLTVPTEAAVKRPPPPQYEVVEIQAGGSNIIAYSGTLRLNNSNLVSGAMLVESPVPHFESFLWHPERPVQWLGAGEINDLNDAGAYVGTVTGAVVTSDGGTLKASAINNSGQVAGRFGSRAFITDSNGQFYFPIESEMVSSEAFAINSFGIAAGRARNPGEPDHVFVFTPTNGVDLGWIRRTRQNEAIAINDPGTVASTAISESPSARHLRSFIHRAGKRRDLRSVRSSPNTLAFAMNNSDEIVGFLGNRLNPDTGGVTIAAGFLYTGGKLYDLNQLLAPSSAEWRVLEALDINDSGAIVAFAARPGERKFPVLLRRVSTQ